MFDTNELKQAMLQIHGAYMQGLDDYRIETMQEAEYEDVSEEDDADRN